MSELRMLRFLAENPRWYSGAELCALLGISTITMRKVLDALLAERLLETKQEPDFGGPRTHYRGRLVYRLG